MKIDLEIEGGEVAGYENIRDKGFDKRSTEELREIQSRGGKKSGEVRRRKADFRKTLNLLLTAEIDNEEWKPVLESLGVECTESALLMAQIKEAMQGNTKAAYFVAQYAGQNAQTAADDKEQKRRTERMEADTEKIRRSFGNAENEDEGVEIINDAPKKQVRISDIVIPKYLPIFNNRSIKHIILTSGRAGTKSSYAAIRSDYQLVSDANGSVVVLRKHHNKLRKTVYKEMLRGINRLEIPKSKFRITKSPMEITYKKYGTTMYFAGSDGIDDTKGIIDEDKPIKLVVLDELTEFFDDGEGEDELSNIEATFVRGNKGGFQMIYLYNPPKNPNAPINQWCKKMEKRPDCVHIHTDYRDVPAAWLGPDLIASAKAMEVADPKMYRWVWLGESVGVDELIYYMFGERHRQKPIQIEDMTEFILAVTMANRMRQHFKHLALILTEKSFRD